MAGLNRVSAALARMSVGWEEMEVEMEMAAVAEDEVVDVAGDLEEDEVVEEVDAAEDVEAAEVD